jgi:hypothetical protein
MLQERVGNGALGRHIVSLAEGLRAALQICSPLQGGNACRLLRALTRRCW